VKGKAKVKYALSMRILLSVDIIVQMVFPKLHMHIFVRLFVHGYTDSFSRS
jgi:hypothetical protein